MAKNGVFTKAAAVAVLVGAIGGGFNWLDANFVSAGEFQREQQTAQAERTELRRSMIEMQLRQIEGELYDRKQEYAASPNEIVARRIQELDLDKRFLQAALSALISPRAGDMP